MHLINWNARRAGAGMTVRGEDSSGAQTKLTDIVRLESAIRGQMPVVIATSRMDEQHTLGL